MNFGTSINGRNAKAEGRAPASQVASWVGAGITAAWIARHVGSTEWHHAAANLGGDGRPVDYYEREDALAAWLASNYAARNASPVARRRLPALVALARDWGVSSLPTAAPLPAPRQKLAEQLVGVADLVRRTYTRQRSRWVPMEIRERITSASWRGDWLVWAGGRCRRDSVVSLAPVAPEVALADSLTAWLASVDRHHAAQDAEARQCAQLSNHRAACIARYIAEPTPGRRLNLSQQWRMTAAEIDALTNPESTR